MGGVTAKAELEAAWQIALAAWDERPLLTTPVAKAGRAIAYIDLVARQIHVDLGQLKKKKVKDCLPAVLAHEIGHHLEHPHTLRLAADLELLGRDLLPTFTPSHLNLFFDLLVNEHVGRDPVLRQQLVRVYRAFAGATSDALFRFYLAIYEALWQERILERPFEDAARADAFVQTFYALGDVHDQLVYFCAAFAKLILDEPEEDKRKDDYFRDYDLPDAGDYPPDLRPSPAARRAIRRGRERGWVPDEPTPGEFERDPAGTFQRIDRLQAGRPGTARIAFREALVHRLYAHAVERTLEGLILPPLPAAAEPLVPTTLEEWEQGDDFGKIDWAESLGRRGLLGAIVPLERELIPDDALGAERGVPRLEIYLDTSGSMPSPLTGLNCMTLAAQVLATLAVRKGASVRAVVYSSGPPMVSDWMRSEGMASRFLFNYSGGGTDFPFDIFAAHADEERGVLRVVISDLDFASNLESCADVAVFVRAIQRSERVALLLLMVERERLRPLAARWPERLDLVTVERADDLPGLGARLASALLGESAA